MKKEDLQPLIGNYLNGFKMVKIEEDLFIKGQINLWTDIWKTDYFGDKILVKFFVNSKSNSAQVYQELIDKTNKQLRDNWNKLKEYLEKIIIDSKAGGNQQYYYKQIYDFVIELEQGSDNQ